MSTCSKNPYSFAELTDNKPAFHYSSLQEDYRPKAELFLLLWFESNLSVPVPPSEADQKVSKQDWFQPQWPSEDALVGLSRVWSDLWGRN